MLRALPAAVIVATHDPEFAAAFADRVVLLADGAVIADGPVAELLATGTYFVTETARVLGGAGGALTPEEGTALLTRIEPGRGRRVSWQLGASAVLVLALAAGFAWYERSRPDARVLALVATLAAFAALGRIAFAALPNVKPTTDIVLLSGFALGPAPGFVVGAVAGLTSNFFFGQGPWTPWQMVGWGVTGLIGAGVAGLVGRRIGRWPLALLCLIVGFAFTALQDVGDWVNFSDHSPAQLGIYVGKGLGFDTIHALGCLVFALAFGPALARSLERFVRRLEVRWVAPARTAGTLLVLVLSAGALVGPAGTGPARAAASPTTYLLAAQNSDGGFGSAPGQPSSQLFSGWAALGLAGAGENLGAGE